MSVTHINILLGHINKMLNEKSQEVRFLWLQRRYNAREEPKKSIYIPDLFICFLLFFFLTQSAVQIGACCIIGTDKYNHAFPLPIIEPGQLNYILDP
jgi:hypothetical protein